MENDLVLNVVLPKYLEITNTKFGYGVISKQSFKKGDVVYESQFVIMKKTRIPDYNTVIVTDEETKEEKSYTIQLCNRVYYDGIYECVYSFDSFANHNCDPTVYEVRDIIPEEELKVKDQITVKFKSIARKDIKEGDHISYHYGTFYYLNDTEFTCECGFKNCIGIFKGYKYLEKEQKEAIADIITPIIKKLEQLDSS